MPAAKLRRATECFQKGVKSKREAVITAARAALALELKQVRCSVFILLIWVGKVL